MAKAPVQGTAKQMVSRLVAKGIGYWTLAISILVATATLSPHIYETLHLDNARSWLFQQMLQHPRPPQPKFVRIVLIEDDQYWKAELAGRRPIKLSYVKKIMEKLADTEVKVIAVDFDLRTPNPDTFNILPDYQDEVAEFVKGLAGLAAGGRKIILPTPIHMDQQGRYRRDRDPFQAYGLCRHDSDTEPSPVVIGPEFAQLIAQARPNVRCGYIALPKDLLIIPRRWEMADGRVVDSFAGAIVRAAVEVQGMKSIDVEHLGDKVKYTSFISENELRKSDTVVSAGTLLALSGDDWKKFVATSGLGRAHAVIIGAGWSLQAAGRGDRVDEHDTPVGPVVGAMLHANYVEAILDTRLVSFISTEALHRAEWGFGIAAAVIFALVVSLLGKLVWLLGLGVLLLFCSWAAVHGLGIFFDAYVPLLGLALHSVVDRLIGEFHEKKQGRRRRPGP